MEARSKSFLIRILCTSLVLAAAMGLFNVLIDPYGLFRTWTWDHINDRKPAALSSERLVKRYDVFREAPAALILGDSTVDLGLDARDPAWPDSVQPVYNLGLYGADIVGSYRYLQYIFRYRNIRLVIVGLDFDQFLGRWIIPLDEKDQLRLRGPPQQLRRNDLLQGVLSFDALTDSLDTIVDSFWDLPYVFVAGNSPTGEMMSERALIGSKGMFELWNRSTFNVSTRGTRFPSRMSDLRDLLELCHSNGAKVILMINPVHADLLEAYSLLGYWQQLEDLKRDLVSLTAEVRGDAAGDQIELWDFSGYDRFSTLEVGEATRWFWNSSHYTRELGDLIVRRVFGEEDPEFGVQLTQDTIETHLKSIREQQSLYRQTHAQAVEAMRRLYDEVPHEPAG